MKPKLLDLFCCEGGASVGYARAGFDVYGVDIAEQPRYPFPSHVGDAIGVMVRLISGQKVDFGFARDPEFRAESLVLSSFSAIHASPPCQAFTRAQRIQGNKHPDLLSPARDLLNDIGVPCVIENVPGAPLESPVTLCGAMFGLETYRHRNFESNITLVAPEHPIHVAKNTKMGRPPVEGEFMHIVGNFSGVARGREVMGMQWASQNGLREAIPPAYTEFIGKQLLEVL